MIANLLRQRGNRKLIADLHGRIVAAARRPALFLPPYGVPDTIEGRFDLLMLIAILLLRRLESLPFSWGYRVRMSEHRCYDPRKQSRRFRGFPWPTPQCRMPIPGPMFELRWNRQPFLLL